MMNLYDQQMIDLLSKKRVNLDNLHDVLFDRARGSKASPSQSLSKVLKQISLDLQECEKLIEDHASGTLVVDNAVLLQAVQTIRAGHDALSVLLLFSSVKAVQL